MELEMRNRELEQFTYVSHHDLQEPLRKIIMFSDMVQREAREKLSETSLLRLEKVTNAARRMSAALKDVLNYASLDKEESFELLELNEVMISVQNDLELVIQEKGATVNVAKLPKIKGVPQQMHQLFYNLLNNALKFSKTGESPVIDVKWSRIGNPELLSYPELDHSGNYHCIEIKDNGIGFNQDASDKIFGMFQRLHSRDAFAGTGIGLALCKKVVINHSGIIKAESEPGKGAIFKVILPEHQAS